MSSFAGSSSSYMPMAGGSRAGSSSAGGSSSMPSVAGGSSGMVGGSSSTAGGSSSSAWESSNRVGSSRRTVTIEDEEEEEVTTMDVGEQEPDISPDVDQAKKKKSKKKKKKPKKKAQDEIPDDGEEEDLQEGSSKINSVKLEPEKPVEVEKTLQERIADARARLAAAGGTPDRKSAPNRKTATGTNSNGTVTSSPTSKKASFARRQAASSGPGAKVAGPPGSSRVRTQVKPPIQQAVVPQPPPAPRTPAETPQDYDYVNKTRNIHTAKGPKELVLVTRDALVGLLNMLYRGHMHRNITDETVVIELESKQRIVFDGFVDHRRIETQGFSFQDSVALLHDFKYSAKWQDYVNGIREVKNLIPSPFSAKHLWSEEDLHYRKDPVPLYCPMFDIESLMWVMILVAARRVILHSNKQSSLGSAGQLFIRGLNMGDWGADYEKWGKHKASVAWHKMIVISRYGRRCVPTEELLGLGSGGPVPEQLNEAQLVQMCGQFADMLGKTGEAGSDPEKFKSSLMQEVRKVHAMKKAEAKLGITGNGSTSDGTVSTSTKGKGKARDANTGKGKGKLSDMVKQIQEEMPWAADIAEDIPAFRPLAALLREIFIRLDKFNQRYVIENQRPSIEEFVDMYKDFIALFDRHVPKEETWDYIN